MENRFLKSFSKESRRVLSQLVELTEDAKIKEYLELD
jgi:hypothetical protein